MIEKAKNKEMPRGEPPWMTPPPPPPAEERRRAIVARLRCIRECDMPGIGSFQSGQRIEDAALVAKLKGHPFFESYESEGN